MSQQRSDDWFEERRGIPTASGYNNVMANRSTAAYQSYRAEIAWERYTGKIRESYQSKDMERGTELEPLARLRYTLATKNIVEEAEFVRHPILATGASPDGLIGEDGLLEVKVPRWHNHLYTLQNKRVPPQYKWQVVGQQMCTGRQWTDFVSFSDEIDGAASLAIIRVERNDDDIKELEDRLAVFLDEVDELVKFLENYGKEPTSG